MQHVPSKNNEISDALTCIYTIAALLELQPELSTKSTQRAVLQKSCSTVGILLGKFTQFMRCWQYEIRLLGDLFRKLFVKWALSARNGENFFRTLDNL